MCQGRIMKPALPAVNLVAYILAPIVAVISFLACVISCLMSCLMWWCVRRILRLNWRELADIGMFTLVMILLVVDPDSLRLRDLAVVLAIVLLFLYLRRLKG